MAVGGCSFCRKMLQLPLVTVNNDHVPPPSPLGQFQKRELPHARAFTVVEGDDKPSPYDRGQ